MKKISFLIFVILMLFALFLGKVSAVGNITRLDFTEKNPQSVLLDNKDAIRLTSDDGREIIIAVDEIGTKGVRIMGTGYKNDTKNVFSALITKKLYARIDFEDDGVLDLDIRYVGLTDNKAVLDFKRLYPGDIVPHIIGNNKNDNYIIQDNENNSSFYRNGFIIAAVILFIGLVILLVLRKK